MDRPSEPPVVAANQCVLRSPYLTAGEAATYLRTTVQGVYALVKRGRLRPMPGRPGRLLFTREALDRYLTAGYRRGAR